MDPQEQQGSARISEAVLDAAAAVLAFDAANACRDKLEALLDKENPTMYDKAFLADAIVRFEKMAGGCRSAIRQEILRKLSRMRDILKGRTIALADEGKLFFFGTYAINISEDHDIPAFCVETSDDISTSCIIIETGSIGDFLIREIMGSAHARKNIVYIGIDELLSE